MKSRKSFLIRIDPKLYEELARLAAQDFRSINSEIEFLLREAVVRRRGRPAESSKDPRAASDEEPP